MREQVNFQLLTFAEPRVGTTTTTTTTTAAALIAQLCVMWCSHCAVNVMMVSFIFINCTVQSLVWSVMYFDSSFFVFVCVVISRRR